jgi:hypothetical protein
VTFTDAPTTNSIFTGISAVHHFNRNDADVLQAGGKVISSVECQDQNPRHPHDRHQPGATMPTKTRIKKPIYTPVLKLPSLPYEQFVALRDNIAVNARTSSCSGK